MRKLAIIFLWLVPVFGSKAQAACEPSVFTFQDVEGVSCIQLNGQWEFYWNALIAPGDFPETCVKYPFPALWNDGHAGDAKLSSQGFATYRAFVVLPHGKSFQIHLEDVYSSFEVFWNGEIIATNGKVAQSKSSYQPMWKPVFAELENLRDTNEIVLQIANFDHAKGGALEGIEIGEQSYMEYKKLGIMTRDLILTGSLIMGGLFFLGLYFFGRHDKSILYFSLFCLVYSYRIIGFGFYLFHSIFDWSWYITTRLEYIALFLATFLFGRFVKNLYPDEVPKILLNILSVICFGFIALVAFAPTHIYTLSVEPFFIILLVYILLTLVIYVRAHLHKKPGSQYALLSTAVVFAVFAYNILVYFGVLNQWESATFWGYMLFFFSQSLVLSYRFAYYLKDAKTQAELAVIAKTEFLSTISHEIRTPLNAVVGISHFLLEDNPKEDQKENLQSLKYSAEHLTTLINDILDYNKLETGFVELEEIETDLGEVVNSIYKAYNTKAMAKGVKVVLDIDTQIQTSIITDKTRLTQILSNLMDNAVKFTKQGTVTLKIAVLADYEQKIALQFEVIDTGIGVPADKHKMIFERFTQASSSTTREYGGTGLGLSIIRKLLELQGSQIKLKSQPGQGSTFFFKQTYKKGAGKVSSMVNYEEQYQANRLVNKRILLVEDNAMNVMVAERFLNKWKIKTEVAENGAVAVQKAQETYYDLVLMDLQMPVMDGYEAAMAIRKSGNKVPIVALTASALISIQEKVMASGMNDYITKPFNPEELKKKLIKNIFA